MYPTSVGSPSQLADNQFEDRDGAYRLVNAADCRLMIFSVKKFTHSGSRLRFYLALYLLGEVYTNFPVVRIYMFLFASISM